MTATAIKRKEVTEKTVVEILTCRELSNTQMGRLLDLHPSTINRIRIGRMHGNIRPDIARWQPALHTSKASCWSCQHVETYYETRPDGSSSSRPIVKCGIGLPDPLVHGPKFARDCSIFLNKEESPDS
jgi:hypothetical protein